MTIPFLKWYQKQTLWKMTTRERQYCKTLNIKGMTLSSIVTQGEGTKGMSIHIDLTESDWQYLNT